MTLNARAWLAFVVVTVVMCALLFGSAGTIRYWQAWVYVAIFVVASVPTSVYLMKKDPALLARRMRGGPMFEKEGTQRIIMTFTSLGFVAILVVAGLDRRFGWSAVPAWAVVLGDLLVATGFLLICVVYRENTFAASTIQVAPGQTVIDGSVRDRAPSDVRERSSLYVRNPARARLVLGLSRVRCHDAVPAVAASRRRENSDKRLAGIR